MAEIERCSMSSDIVLPGQIAYESLPAVYAHAKVNIFASECENCPNIMLEALGSGRPLLAADRPPMRELGGDAALYFEPEKPASLADTLHAILKDDILLARIAENVVKRADRYSWKETADATWRALTNACIR